MENDIILEDTTLRDGEQSPGVAFSKETKLTILKLLEKMGVRWVEVGIPAMGGEELEALELMLETESLATLVAWNRGVMADIKFSIDLGFKAIHIGLPASSIHLETSVQKDREWLMRTARELIGYAVSRGVYVSVSAEDVGRTDRKFLQEYARVVSSAGASRLRLSDTIGILTPEMYAERVTWVRDVCDTPIQCHTHNDFGLAVANTIAGIRAGARFFHVTVNGIGERAGMPDLGQTVMALKMLYGVDLGIDTCQILEVSQVVATACGYPVVPWQPIVGANVFAHESGIHVNAMQRDRSSFEPFSPEAVGGRRSFVIGKHSGKAGIRACLEEQGLFPEGTSLEECLRRVRSLSIRQGGAVCAPQVAEIYAEVMADSR